MCSYQIKQDFRITKDGVDKLLRQIRDTTKESRPLRAVQHDSSVG